MKNTNKRNVVLTERQSMFVIELLESYGNLAKIIAQSTLGNYYSYLLEDCIAELYLLICEKIAIIEKHPNPKAWIIVAAKTTALKLIKKHKKDSLSQSLDLDVASDLIDETDVFEEALYDIWLEEKVPEKIISSLTKRERVIYQKLYIEKKKPKIVAKELGISVSTVWNFNKLIKEKIKNKINHGNF